MTVADVQSALQAVQAQIAAIQAVIAAGPTSTGGSSFAAALDSATASTTDTTTTSGASTATATASADTLASNGTTGHDVAEDALKYVGVPYVYGGESRTGMDCSGLVQKVFSDLGVSVPRLVHEQQTIGTKVSSLSAAKPGDLIVLNGGDHVAIYLGNDTVIHAPYAGRTVSVQKVWFGDKDITAIRRVVPSDSTGTTSTDASTAAQLLALQGDSSTSTSSSASSLSSLLSELGSSSSSSSTAQQLLAARASMLAGAAA